MQIQWKNVELVEGQPLCNHHVLDVDYDFNRFNFISIQEIFRAWNVAVAASMILYSWQYNMIVQYRYNDNT